MSPHRRLREKTVINKSSLFKDKNIKSYKTSLFNKNSLKNLKTKDENIKDNIKGIKYKGMSHKFLLMGLEIKGDKNESAAVNYSLNKKISKKHRKNKIKYKKSPENGIYKLRSSGKNLLVKNYKMSPHRRKNN